MLPGTRRGREGGSAMYLYCACVEPRPHPSTCKDWERGYTCQQWKDPEDKMSKIDPAKVAQLEEFVHLCQEQPAVLHLPEMSFFKAWVERLVL